MENLYRPLTAEEIELLERRGCWANDWSQVQVVDPFDPARLQQVRFSGTVRLGALNGTVWVYGDIYRPCGIRNAELRDVTVGNYCLIENIGTYLSEVEIGDDCYLSNIGLIEMLGETTFAQGRKIHVLQETGSEHTLVLHRQLSSQEAYLMAKYGLTRMVDYSEVLPKKEECTVCRLGNKVRIVGTKTLRNVLIGDGAYIMDASLLQTVTVDSSEDCPTTIYQDCVIYGSIISEGAELYEGAKLEGCFIGQAVHIGKGFSATDSVFFANSYMDNGEACAVVAGPFTTSHHKCSLLIGCLLSYANIGSGTNMSNHAYKMGPVHFGCLEKGVKTASNTHLVWPGTIGAFSMVSGKTPRKLDASDFPFSYLFCEGNRVQLVPAVNGVTYGTYRDVSKWVKRDKRQNPYTRDVISEALLITPDIMEKIHLGRSHLLELQKESPEANQYEWKGMTISASALKRGIELYDFLESLFWGSMEFNGYLYPTGEVHLHEDPSIMKDGWENAFGLLLPKSLIGGLFKSKADRLIPISEIQQMLKKADDDYCSFIYTWAVRQCGMTWEDIQRSRKDYVSVLERYRHYLQKDLEKEFTQGSVSQSALEEEMEGLNKSFEEIFERLKR